MGTAGGSGRHLRPIGRGVIAIIRSLGHEEIPFLFKQGKEDPFREHVVWVWDIMSSCLCSCQCMSLCIRGMQKEEEQSMFSVVSRSLLVVSRCLASRV